jgi:hypothetical protein
MKLLNVKFVLRKARSLYFIYRELLASGVIWSLPDMNSDILIFGSLYSKLPVFTRLEFMECN